MNPLVSVHMITFNHEKYISQAIESILAQRVDFAFEFIIGEDNSTDETRGIVSGYASNYPNLIKMISSAKNVGVVENSRRVTAACQGKYIAYCEGDDFWQNRDKLQKQVDFLERNPEYGLVHTEFDVLNESNRKTNQNFNAENKIIIPSGRIFCELLDPAKYLIRTPTACFRKEYLLNFPIYEIMEKRGWHLDDLPLWLEIAHHSKIMYLSESCATYRVLPESASNTSDARKKVNLHRAVYDVRYFMIDRYGCSEKIKSKIDRYYSRALLGDAFQLKDMNIAQEAITMLEQKGLKPKIKDWLYFYGAKINFINKTIRKIKKTE